MTRGAGYGGEEWALLTNAVEVVGLGMLGVSKSGLVGKLRELAALSRCLTRRALPIQFARNKLVLALLEGPHAHEPVSEPLAYLSRDNMAGLIAAIVTSHLHMLNTCEQVAALLAAKAPLDEADGVKRWLLWIARSVAEASGDRWLGLGRKVSDAEARMLTQLAAALDISSIVRVPTVAQLDALLGPAPRGSGGVSGGSEGHGHGRGGGR